MRPNFSIVSLHAPRVTPGGFCLLPSRRLHAILFNREASYGHNIVAGHGQAYRVRA